MRRGRTNQVCCFDLLLLEYWRCLQHLQVIQWGVSSTETPPPPANTKLIAQTEIEFAKCGCCGLSEECTQAYIEMIRKRYQGKWICGLCAEVIKDEIIRTERLITTKEAMAEHTNYCKKFKSSGPPPDAAIHLISAMKHVLRKSLDSPRGLG